jgi:hypothetical protein
MKPPPQPSGLNRGLGILIPDDWTPEQAQAVVEVLDDLRERIWEHYALPLQDRYREQRQPDDVNPPPQGDSGQPF